ncbi:MAG: SusD/RagB family nutrient-binding outer membrane lipoprotein [Cyclobacteriaceae bacterium]
MKKIYPILLLSILITSCDFGSLNVDPNNPNPNTVPLALMLPSAQASLAYNIGGRGSWNIGMFTNHLTGVIAQPQDFSNYNYTESDCDGLWRDMYATTMITFRQIIEKADKQTGGKYYAGIAKVLLATSLGTMTSYWGDIPYTDAFKGSVANITPKFDTQQAVYGSIQGLLDEAISDLSSPTGIQPADDDLIYGGELEFWIRAAYSLKARYFIHQTKSNPSAAASALSALSAAKGITSVEQQAQMVFGINQTDSNPWYQLNRQRPDVRVSASFIAILDSFTDPRKGGYVDQRASGPFVGLKYSSIDSPVPIISFAEVKFIEAEALVRTGGAGAQAAFQAAIDASIVDVTGASNSAYLAANGTLSGTQTQQLGQILTQKYIALFTQSESWVDYRRTGVPALTPPATVIKNEANPNGDVPRRLPYPISERLFNAANIPTQSPSLQTPRLWIDN